MIKKNLFLEDFFNRTMFNLEKYRNNHKTQPDEYKYEVTQLINSFLGSIVFINELRGNNKYSKEAEEFVCNLENITWQDADTHKNFKCLLKRLRNAISHAKITLIGNKINDIEYIKFTDREFKIELSLKNIYDFIKILENEVKFFTIKKQGSLTS